MAQGTFDAALKALLIHEGGYTNHPDDPGGPTNWGITLADARRYWKADAGAKDVASMPVSVAGDIYRTRYWQALKCDELPTGLDYCVFDYGVNSGVQRAGRVLRQVLGINDASGRITRDIITLAAQKDAAPLIRAICAERLAFLQRLKTWPVFGRGWSRRVREVEVRALTMARALPSTAAPSVLAPDQRPLSTSRAGRALTAFVLLLKRLLRRRGASPSTRRS